jgi:BRCA1-associated protein
MSSSVRRSNHRIRQRPVSFGNPALGTYHGFVYTLQETATASQSSSSRPLVEGAEEVRRLVAMVNVPPNQVPEGILNLARSHRPWIDHVRIVIAENEDDDDGDEQQQQAGGGSSRKGDDEEKQNDEATTTTNLTLRPSPNASAMESAASILAEEQIQQRTAAAATATVVVTDVDRHADTRSRNKEEQHQSRERTYLVLIELCSEEAADVLVEDLHGQPYTSLDETVTCSVHHVVALQGVAGVSLMSPFFAPHTAAAVMGTTSLELLPSASQNLSSNSSPSPDAAIGFVAHSPHATGKIVLSEDYNCAVCLEHMDLDTRPSTSSDASAQHTSILTTVCNHSFHMDCLLQWQDSPCPVCRYDHSGLNETLSQCHVCGTTENNYVCLICGVVSCGDSAVAAAVAARQSFGLAECRSDDTLETAASQQQHHRILLSSSHARTHYDETLHAYALNTETQHVWDFAGQGYVHRLLQNKEDGKLVEVNDPSNTTSQERSLSPGLTEAQEGEVVHRKLEGFASQYYTLLKSQLEQQRIYYEGRLEEIRRDYSDTRKQRVGTTDLIAALKQESHQLSKRLSSVQTKCCRVQDDVGFIKSLNESLEANREPLRRQVEKAQRDRMETRKMFEECLPPLQEKVTRLMLQLESSSSTADVDFTENASKKPAAR